MANVIKQVVKEGEYGVQTIKMLVRDNERGPQGKQGEQGDAATVTAGNAYSVPATQEPSVINTGTSSNAVFDFYIPHGEVDWGDIGGDISKQEDLEGYLEKADTAVQPEDIDYTVMQDLDVSSTTSTNNMQLDAAKVNLMSGTVSSKDIPLPVASSTTAGVMNSSTFDAVANNSANISTILGGMVAIDDLPASPTQSELTTAWQTATGATTPPNYAHILDTSNDKYWTYFTNTATWYSGSADIQVEVSPFTNATAGVIKGSTNVGQVFAESDGTGSVNGWDSLDSRVTNNTNNMLRVGQVLSQPTTVAYVDTANIVDEAVTADKIDFTTFPGEHYLGKASSDGSFTLPAGYSIYHVRGEVFYTTSSANAAIQILTSNYTGESWARRIEERDGDGKYEVIGDQFSYTNGGLVLLGSGVALGTSGGRVLIDLTFMRGSGNKLLVSGTFNHSGANSSGFATGETPMSSGAGGIPCWFISSNSPRTFSNANIVITGIV